MRTLLETLLILGIVVLIIFSLAYLYLLVEGGKIIKERLEALTHRKVAIGLYNIAFPLNIELKNLDIDGLAKVETIIISPSIPYLFVGSLALNNIKIIRPEITYERVPVNIKASTDSTIPKDTAASLSLQNQAAPKIEAIPSRPFPLRVIIKNLTIENGKINFVDHSVGGEGIRITVKDIAFNLNNLFLFPFPVITNFDLKGRIPWQQGAEEGKIDIEGWANFYKKDMQASLNITGIDAVYLYPYYSSYLDLAKAHVEKANLNFTSNIHGLHNNVTAECHLELTEIVRKPREPEESMAREERIANAVLDIFKALDQGKIVLDFTLRTKMDKPRLGIEPLKVAFEDKITQGTKGGKFDATGVLMLPAKLIESTVRSAADVSKAVIDGTFAVGNEFKKAIESSFRRDYK